MSPPLAQVRELLRQARQYVSDAGNDEDAETQRNSQALLDEIDAVLTAERPEAAVRENLTAKEFAQVLPRPEAAVACESEVSPVTSTRAGDEMIQADTAVTEDLR